MHCICYTIVFWIIIQSSVSGVACASVQESVSSPKVAFLVSYLEAWNLQSGMNLQGRQELQLKQGQRVFLYIFAYLSARHVQ